jgi:hypothetical protein
VASPLELAVADMKAQYAEQASSPTFDRLYEDDAEFGHAFSVLHKRLNQHFDGINDRARSTHHYWADPSRDLIGLIAEINEFRHLLSRVGIEIKLDDRYQAAIERCEPWLSSSGGSQVPDDFEAIDTEKYAPVFTRPAVTVDLKKGQSRPKLTMVGEGSYAVVHSYVDPDYGIKFAVKRAKRGLSERDLARFRQEFDVMKRLRFPYVVQVYQYDQERDEYRMEYCDETLRTYVAKRNGTLGFGARKRIALQFLYGLNYLHTRQLLHRDISLQNVLLKVYDGGAVLVKLSDFGLVKERSSDFTRTQTEMRGTIRDPLLDRFKDYGIGNEIYSIGWVLSYIFTGKESLNVGSGDVGAIIQKCTSADILTRYKSVMELISDVDHLEAVVSETPP